MTLHHAERGWHVSSSPGITLKWACAQTQEARGGERGLSHPDVRTWGASLWMRLAPGEHKPASALGMVPHRTIKVAEK